MNFEEIAKNNLIYKTLTGSQMYGLSTENSDRDETGVFIPSKDSVLGIYNVEQVEIKTNLSSSGKSNTKDDIDLVIYSLPKFLKLLANGNPNIIELLFSPKNCILHTSKYWEKILENKDLFISLKIKHTFLGYAFSQRHKIITKQKTYKEYCKHLESGLNKEEALKKLKNPIGNRLKYYEKFGFDVKYASHLIRLLYEGLEFLKEGEIHLPLHQNNQILNIKEGNVKLEDVLELSDELEKNVNEIYIKSTLPKEPNWKKINDLQIELLEDYWYGNLEKAIINPDKATQALKDIQNVIERYNK